MMGYSPLILSFFSMLLFLIEPTSAFIFEKRISAGETRNNPRRGSQTQMTQLQTRKLRTDWPFWFVLPIAPYSKRDTFIKEVVQGQIWTFDQLQGILYVFVPIRMTVIKMEEGGLFVYAPVAPTEQVISSIRNLEKIHGPLKHIILPTLGLEHKVFAGPFAQKFPKAKVWYTPGQYSFPIKLPLSWLGFGFNQQVRQLPRDSSKAPFYPEFDYRIVGPLLSKDKAGGFGEAAFYHKKTQTLLTTDIVVKVGTKIPEIILTDPRCLLFHARDSALDKVEKTPATLAKGWRHVQQFALFFPAW